MIRLSPGSSVPWKRPSRSITQALCCGTMRTPSMTKAIATPSTSTQPQYFDNAGTNDAAMASTTATASFQNMADPPLGGTVLRDFQRIALGGEHVNRGPRLEPFPSLHARVPARSAVTHARQARGSVDPALEARRHARIDMRHLLALVSRPVDVHAVAADRSHDEEHDRLRAELEPQPGGERGAERGDA